MYQMGNNYQLAKHSVDFLFCSTFQEGERLFRAHSHFDIRKGGTQGFPRHEVSDKQEVLFEDVSPSTAFSIRQLATS